LGKKQKKHWKNPMLLFTGRSGEIRTRGLLNPIGPSCAVAGASTLQIVKKAGISPELQIFVVGIRKKCTPICEKVYPDALCVV